METQQTNKRIFTRKNDFNRFMIMQELNRRIDACARGGILLDKHLAYDIANTINCSRSLARVVLRDFSYGRINRFGDIIDNNTKTEAVC